MIIVKLMGGLGNQMFQYAAGRRLAHVHGTELKLDHTFLETEKNIATPRKYELHRMHVRCGRASASDCSTIALEGVGWLPRILRKVRTLDRQLAASDRFILERSYRFEPEILGLPDNVYLEGYWQSERYFTDIAEIIRREFTVLPPPEGKNSEVANDISKCQAVSLHVRRGDYATDPQTARFHGVCGLEYYEKAVAAIVERVLFPHFFIFSDEPAWVQENLQLHFPVTFMNHNDPDHGFEDLRLMSLCRHHIIANSSFSWWGAWLGANPCKTVIAPKRWFNDEQIDTSDIIPETWIRM